MMSFWPKDPQGVKLPRVARVEAAEGTTVFPAAVTKVSAASSEAPRSSTVLEATDERGVTMDATAVQAGLPGPEDATDDQPELIPDTTGRLERLEALLLEVVEENKNLTRRIHQTESDSSWHSGLTRGTPGEVGVPSSPASFGLGPQGVQGVFPPHVGNFPPVPASGMSGFPDSLQGVRVGSWEQGFRSDPGNLQSLIRARQGQVPSVGPSVSLGEVDFASRALAGFGAPVGDYGCSDLRGFERPERIAPPIPLALPSGSPGVSPPAPPQSLRQIASAILGGGQVGSEGSGFQTPRGRSVDGYPVSPGGTVIRPPPGPPPISPRDVVPSSGTLRGINGPSVVEEGTKPEEPARYISELPKLAQTDLSQSAVVCGNWLAQVRQVLVGLSPGAGIWWQGVELPATEAYQRWLVADPLGRLGIDPSSVKGRFDEVRFGRVESRAVSLLLAAVPQSVRDDVVTNRWLSSVGILFRILCIFQPGGSSERAHLLGMLVNPETCKTFGDSIKCLRRWQQSLQRASEIHATLPDPSLLLKGVDSATGALLTAHPMVGFRINTFRQQLAIDYNPSVSSVMQLVKLILAESEAASLTSELPQDKRARAAAAQAAATNANPNPLPGTGGGGKGDVGGKGSGSGVANPVGGGLPAKVAAVEAGFKDALTSASDPDYCLVDSGATNALRPASTEEIEGCRVIRVDLASGGTELRINSQGTLLHVGRCQVILPASYLVSLGYGISWRKKGCRIRHPRLGVLEVTVVKGCPLIPKQVGLELIRQYEMGQSDPQVLKKVDPRKVTGVPSSAEARGWLRDRLRQKGGQGVKEVDQLRFLIGVFPGVPVDVLGRACVSRPTHDEDTSQLPWNRRLRRSVSRAKPESVLLNCSDKQPGWKGLGRVIQVPDSAKGLGSGAVFRRLLEWAESGVIGGGYSK